jgi:predicted Zn-dependent protease
MRMKDADLVEMGWRGVEGALEAFHSSEELLAMAGSPEAVPKLGLILGGDVTVLQERIAVGSTHFPGAQADQNTVLVCFLTAMVEGVNAKGSGWWVGNRLGEFSSESGAMAARNAVRAAGGVRVDDGEYRVVLGRQAVMDLVTNVLLPSLQLDVWYAGASAFQGRLMGQVAWPGLSIYDDGARPGLAGSKAITCEGLPTGRTDLIRGGRLVGLLSNYYRYQQMLHDPRARDKLGVDVAQHRDALLPRNGFRFGKGGGRHFDIPPGIFGTNVILEGEEPCSHEELVRRVGDGLYIGRLWYTYPINGLAAGDFTSTVIGDSFVIRGGRLAEPLKPNTVRINGNIRQLLEGIVAVGDRPQGTVVWASDQIVYTPEMVVAGVEARGIAEYMDAVYQTAAGSR